MFSFTEIVQSHHLPVVIGVGCPVRPLARLALLPLSRCGRRRPLFYRRARRLITPSQLRGGILSRYIITENNCLFITAHLIPIPQRSWKSLSLEVPPVLFRHLEERQRPARSAIRLRKTAFCRPVHCRRKILKTNFIARSKSLQPTQFAGFADILSSKITAR